MIKFVFIDLDDTILDFSVAEHRAIRATFEHFGVPVTEENISLYSKLNRSVWSRIEKGELTRSEAMVKRFAMLYAQLNIQADGAKTNEFYLHAVSQCAVFVQGAKELLQQLQGKYRLFAASNGNAVVQKPRIKAAELEKYFENIFISQEIGFDKPNEKYFEKCFEQIENFNKDEAIILGDSLTSDVLGGKNAKIKTCWYNPMEKESENLKPDFEIRSLEEFLGVLEQL